VRIHRNEIEQIEEGETHPDGDPADSRNGLGMFLPRRIGMIHESQPGCGAVEGKTQQQGQTKESEMGHGSRSDRWLLEIGVEGVSCKCLSTFIFDLTRSTLRERENLGGKR
jgi:hypothetical protein